MKANLMTGCSETNGVLRRFRPLLSSNFIALVALAVFVIPIWSAKVELPVVGTWPGHTRGWVESVELQGDYAYVVAGSLQIVDVTDPDAPKFVSAFEPVGKTVRGVDVSGDIAYVAALSDGLQILDITNPNQPALVGQLEEVGAFEVVSFGTFAYVNSGGKIHIVDVSNSASPILIQSITSDGDSVGGHGIAVAENTLYEVFRSRSSGQLKVKVYDVLDPAVPKLVHTLGYSWNNNTSTSLSVELSGEHLVVGGGSALKIFNISDPKLPSLVADYSHGYEAGLSDMQVAGDTLYLTGWVDGPEWNFSGRLEILDISNPTSPKLVGQTLLVGQHLTTLSVHGGLACLGADPGGLLLTDVSDAASPTLISSFPAVSGYLGRAVVSDGHAYLFEGRAGLQILDVSDRSNPTRVSTLPEFGTIDDAAVSAGLLALSLPETGLLVLDVSVPSLPVVLSEWSTDIPADRRAGNSGEHLAFSKSYLLYAGIEGLDVIDLNNPEEPTLAARLLPGQKIMSFAVQESLLFVSVKRSESNEAHIVVFDISGLPSPQEVGRTGGLGLSQHIIPIAENIIGIQPDYPGDAYQLDVRLNLLDFSDLENPQVVDWIPVEDRGAYPLATSYEGVVFKPEFDKVRVFDVVSLGGQALFRDRGSFTLPGYSRMVFEEDHAFAVSGDALAASYGLQSYGLQIVDLRSLLSAPSIDADESGKTVRWRRGGLQFSPSVNGPWTDLPVASPMNLETIGEKGFFRVELKAE